MSIPFVWQEVRWDAAWGSYCCANIAGHYVIGVAAGAFAKWCTS